jgi:hypothetical protein
MKRGRWLAICPPHRSKKKEGFGDGGIESRDVRCRIVGLRDIHTNLVYYSSIDDV